MYFSQYFLESEAIRNTRLSLSNKVIAIWGEKKDIVIISCEEQLTK